MPQRLRVVERRSGHRQSLVESPVVEVTIVLVYELWGLPVGSVAIKLIGHVMEVMELL